MDFVRYFIYFLFLFNFLLFNFFDYINNSLNSCIIDKVENLGGLAILWQRVIKIELLSYSQNHIDSVVQFHEESDNNSIWISLCGLFGLRIRFEIWMTTYTHFDSELQL